MASWNWIELQNGAQIGRFYEKHMAGTVISAEIRESPDGETCQWRILVNGTVEQEGTIHSNEEEWALHLSEDFVNRRIMGAPDKEPSKQEEERVLAMAAAVPPKREAVVVVKKKSEHDGQWWNRPKRIA